MFAINYYNKTLYFLTFIVFWYYRDFIDKENILLGTLQTNLYWKSFYAIQVWILCLCCLFFLYRFDNVKQNVWYKFSQVQDVVWWVHSCKVQWLNISCSYNRTQYFLLFPFLPITYTHVQKVRNNIIFWWQQAAL